MLVVYRIGVTTYRALKTLFLLWKKIVFNCGWKSPNCLISTCASLRHKLTDSLNKFSKISRWRHVIETYRALKVTFLLIEKYEFFGICGSNFPQLGAKTRKFTAFSVRQRFLLSHICLWTNSKKCCSSKCRTSECSSSLRPAEITFPTAIL